MNDSCLYRTKFFDICTGSSKIIGAKLSDACSVRANWLCMGWPFCLAEMRREFQTGGKFFCTKLYTDMHKGGAYWGGIPDPSDIATKAWKWFMVKGTACVACLKGAALG